MSQIPNHILDLLESLRIFVYFRSQSYPHEVWCLNCKLSKTEHLLDEQQPCPTGWKIIMEFVCCQWLISTRFLCQLHRSVTRIIGQSNLVSVLPNIFHAKLKLMRVCVLAIIWRVCFWLPWNTTLAQCAVRTCSMQYLCEFCNWSYRLYILAKRPLISGQSPLCAKRHKPIHA